ncbi:MAG: ComEC/Rec2 family competence protein [Planctomycetaceae bacterium]|nr:ComEC/Rec2 family competence protein [Planctomycetaceae bacterium]
MSPLRCLKREVCPLIGVLASAIIGIVIDRYVPQSAAIYWVVVVGCSITTIIGFSPWLRKVCTTTFICVVFALLHHFDWWVVPPDEFSRQLPANGVALAVEGSMMSAAQYVPATEADVLSAGISKPRMHFWVHITRVRQLVNGQPAWITTSGRGMVYCRVSQAEDVVRFREDFKRGALVKMFGSFHRYQNGMNPGGWDAAEFYWDTRRCFQAHCSAPSAIELQHAHGTFSIMRVFDSTRQWMLDNLERRLAPRNCAVAGAILLGERNQISVQRMQMFMCTGTIHLFAISGLHVGMLALVLTFPLRFFPRWKGTVLTTTVLIIWAYAVLTGGRPPVVRASILISTFCICNLSYRVVIPANTLALAGIIILAHNPSSLFQIGTQLSFLATAALFGCRSLLRQTTDNSALLRFILRLQPWPVRCVFWFVEAVTASFAYTLAMWIVCIALVLHGFHIISVVGIVLNVILAIPIITSFVLTLLLAFLEPVPFVGTALGWLCQWSISLLDWIVTSTAQGEIGFWWAAGPTRWWLISFYLMLGGVALWSRMPRLQKSGFALVALYVVLSIGWCPQRVGLTSEGIEQEHLGLHFIAVGHGTAVLLEYPNGEVWLYDAGSLMRSNSAGRLIADVLWQRGHSRLSGIYVSHADLDHFNAVKYLAERFQLSFVRTTPRMQRQLRQAVNTTAVGVLWAELERQQVDVQAVTVGDQWPIGLAGDISVLSPQRGERHESDNEASLVLKLRFGNQRVLLPGDIEEQGVQRLIAREQGGFEIVMLPHHGSQHSLPKQMANWAKPQVVVASTGHSNLPRQVREIYDAAVARRGGTVYVTSQQGMVSFKIGLDGFTTIVAVVP